MTYPAHGLPEWGNSPEPEDRPGQAQEDHPRQGGEWQDAGQDTGESGDQIQGLDYYETHPEDAAGNRRHPNSDVPLTVERPR